MFGRIGPMELILILVIALVIFGPSKLPEVGRSLGKAINEFKNSSKEITDDIAKTINNDQKDA
jgi:sec-independent protein translocase protein TatA